MTRIDRDRINEDFAEAVNMSAEELEDWLSTPESLSVGQKQPDGEFIGHASGRRIAEILRIPQPKLAEEDYRHMRKAVGFVRRHRAQEPANMVTSRWRYALMNWGHDPLR